MTLAENLQEIKSRAAKAADLSGRKAEAVRLIAVTKTVPYDIINEAIALGITEIGENRSQEWASKMEFVNIPKERVHFIGQIQSNKLKSIMRDTNIIHSLDKLSAAKEIERICSLEDDSRDVLVQVDIGREPQKGGVLEEDLPGLLEGVAGFTRVNVCGLMCVPPFDKPARPYFAKMREIAAKMAKLGIPNVRMDELSMGMSSDYEDAILEGATMIRVGSALFGSRIYQ